MKMRIVLGFLLISYFLSSKVISSQDLNLITYNLGLAPNYVPYAKERLPHLIQALKKEQGDIVCLQEVWKDQDRNLILRELGELYPYFVLSNGTQHYLPKRFMAPACSPLDLLGEGKFLTCLLSECSGKSGDDQTQCILNQCRDSLDRLVSSNRSCAKALFSQVGRSTVKSLWNILNPFFKVGLFIYDGSNGTMILSKFPLDKSRSGNFSMASQSTLTNRSSLYSFADIRGEEVFVSCNHLTANLSLELPYAGNFSSWGEENLNQAKTIVELGEDKFTGGPQIFMGDFNCSLENSENGIEGDLSSSCQYLLDSGMQNPHLTSDEVECTFCSQSNDLVGLKNKDDYLIDHIFLKNWPFPGEQRAKVIFKEKINLKSGNKPIKTHLSDHFGVKVSVPL